MVPVPAVLAAIQLAKQAYDAIGSFSGNAAMAKASPMVQDAINIIGAVTPLVQQFANGQDIGPDDVRAALARTNVSMDEYERLIVEKEKEAAHATRPA